MESPETCVHSCFYLSFNGKRINDFIELGEVEGIAADSVLELVEGKGELCEYIQGMLTFL